MTTTWHKAARDIWRGRGRAALVVLSITIGLTGFFAVLSTYAILRRELNRGYLASNPASAVLMTDAVDEEMIAAAIARDDVDDADARRVITGRIRVSATSSRRLMLFVIRDFRHLRISTVTPDGGAWPPAGGDLLIERDAFQVARAHVGDTVTITTPGGQHSLRVAGQVHDVGQAQARMENAVYGYITPDTLALLGEKPVLDRLYLLAGGDRFDEAHVRRVAGAIRDRLVAGGHPVQRMIVPTPGQHPHAVIMGLLLLVMAAFGFFTLILSGVIVATLMLAMVAAERRQIAVMKAVGAVRAQVARVYLVEAGALGVIALALALPAGSIATRVLSERFAVLLNFDLASRAIPAWVYLLVAVVALAVPIAAAAYPVWMGTAVTVRAALVAAEIDPVAFGSGRVAALLSRAGGRRPLLLGVRNSVRRPTRTAVTLGTLTVAGASFIAALSVRTSLMATFDRLYGAGTFGSVSRYALDQHMLMIYVFLLVVAGVLAAVGGLGLATTISINVLDRRRELGVLRALGATPSVVATIVVLEALTIAVVSSVLSIAVAWPISLLVGRLVTAMLLRTGVDIRLSATGIVGWFVITGALAVAASLAPALTASQRPIQEAVSHE